MTAYKLFREKADGSITPLFINKTAVLPFGEWMEAEDHPTKGFAHRPGWHAAFTPEAPHLSLKNRVWCEVEVEDFYEFRTPRIHGGKWIIAKRLRIVRKLEETE